MEPLKLSWLTPALVALVLSGLSQLPQKRPNPSAVTYRYPRAFSVVMILVSLLGMTAIFWLAVRFDRLSAIGFESFFGVFLLIGLALDRFRIHVSEDVIVQGYWPVKNVIPFKDVTETETCDCTKDSYLLVTTRSGKKYKFEQSLENFEGLCSRVMDLASVRGIKVLRSHYKKGQKIYS